MYGFCKETTNSQSITSLYIKKEPLTSQGHVLLASETITDN